jgi:hypothetical protein
MNTGERLAKAFDWQLRNLSRDPTERPGKQTLRGAPRGGNSRSRLPDSGPAATTDLPSLAARPTGGENR